MKINKHIIEELVNRHEGCVIEEIYDGHEVMRNYVCITCNLEEGYDETGCCITLIGNIFDLLLEFEKYSNIKNLINETFSNDEANSHNNLYPYYEYVTFEWD